MGARNGHLERFLLPEEIYRRGRKRSANSFWAAFTLSSTFAAGRFRTTALAAAGRFNMVALVAAGHSNMVWSVRRAIEPSAKHALFQYGLIPVTMCLLMHKHVIAFQWTCKRPYGRPDIAVKICAYFNHILTIF